MPSIYEKYHLKQVINTSGRMTALGVSTPRPDVVQAAMDGMNHYFEMKDLVNKTGEYIAKLLDVEGATVVHKHEARLGEQITVALFPPRRIEEQRAKLAGSRVVITEKKRGQRVIDVQLFRGVNHRTDTVVVPRVVKPDGHFDCANAGHGTGVGIFHRWV